MSKAASTDDYVRRFLLEGLDIRGALVRLGPSWRAMIEGRGYPASVARLLGEMTAVTVLMGSNLKQAGRLSFQLQGSGAVRLMLIDATSSLGLRGSAQHDAEVADGTAKSLFGDGRLLLTLQSDEAPEPYQSLVPLSGDTIAAVFEHFLAQSEQQPARLWLTASADTAAGLFLQKLPGADDRDADGWNRIEQLAATVRPEELAATPVSTLLTQLFPEETLRLFDPRPVHYNCPEDWDKVRRMLRSVGRPELESILAEKGEVLIHDEICNRDYRFSADEIAALFGEAGDAPTVH